MRQGIKKCPGSDCLLPGMQEIAHERAKRASEKAEMDAFKPKAKKKYEGPSLQEIMHEATKEGLQYVAYCKKHGLH